VEKLDVGERKYGGILEVYVCLDEHSIWE